MSYCFIPLTKGQQALVDPSDYDRLMQIGRWCFSQSGYAVHYCSDELGRRQTLYMHRVVMEYALRSAPPGTQVDHFNNVRIDNRRENLRLATRSQNQAHKGKQGHSTSPYKGVNQNCGRWEARIRFAGRRFNLGRYDDPEEAAWMYDTACRLLYNEFAGCNFAVHPSRMYFERVVFILQRRGLNTEHLRRSEPFIRSR
jgi:hypothetical protein